MTDISEWKPEYSVGNPILDSQHKNLLKLCKRVSAYKCDQSKDGINKLHAILNDLALYATEHFATEEQVLRQIGYPKLSEHEKEHNGYSEKLVEFLIAAMDGRIHNSALQNFLEKWCINHILLSDMEYRDFLKRTT